MPNTIAQNLARLQAAKTAIGNAITAKGGTVTSGDGFEAFPADIATIPSGGGGGDADYSKPVRFFDYDGKLVYSYTPQEFAALTAMPANPSHTELTAQGWDLSLADAKAYVAKYGTLNVGQMYITDDGRTRLYVRMQEGRLSPILKLYLNANSELDIDWGDGTAHSTFTSTSADYKSEQHNYASAGEYVVSIGVTSGSFVLKPSEYDVPVLFTAGEADPDSADRGYLNSIEKIEIGSGVTSIEGHTFPYCSSLSQVTIPYGVTSIGSTAFFSCYSLSQVTIPDGVTSIESYAFQYCYSLSQIIIPDDVTSIGNYAFDSCNSLSQVTIPDGVTSIGDYAFRSCYSLSQVTIPESVTSIGSNAFHYCYSLSQVTISDGVTSIGSSAFYSCYSLSQVTIPESVTSIGSAAFRNCYSIGYIKFEGNTPPTVSNSNAFLNVPTDCIIYVPSAALSTYKSATNYPSPSTYTYVGY